MDRNSGGCCKKLPAIKAKLENAEQLLSIALRALKTYQLTASSLTADDALLRMRALDQQLIDRLLRG